MPTDETYGSRFLDALDASLTYKLLRYAERQEIRQMQRGDVITKLKLNRHSAFRGIADVPPEEAARRFADELMKAQQTSAGAFGAGMGVGEVMTLLSLL